MHATQRSCTFGGIVCKFCGRPIQLSTSLVKRETSIKAESALAELASRVFPLRCRACFVEGIYTLYQIVDFPETRVIPEN